MLWSWQHVATLGMVVVLSVAVGCAQKAADPATSGHDGHEGHAETKTVDAGQDDHSGWWCVAHGVPEEECGLCDSALAADLQRKGDWCKEHNRPDSQCFVCHPELENQFAARYEAKYGEAPPKP